MNPKLFSAGLAAAGALAIAATPASAVVIGGASQSSDQGVNATQLANGGTATGNTIVLGTVGPNTGVQDSTNVLSNGQAVGSSDGAGTFIAPTGLGPTQSNHQAVDSQQVAANAAVGEQDSTNVLGSSQIVGGDLSCAGAVCDSSVIIGTPTQASQQGVNSSQSSDGGLTTGDSFTTPTVVFNGLGLAASQFSVNALDSDQIVLG